MLYHFRLIRDSYLEMALSYLHMTKPKNKLSVAPIISKVTILFIANKAILLEILSELPFEVAILVTLCY